jgi:hypothetical protein
MTTLSTMSPPMRCVTPSHNRKAEIVAAADAGAAVAAVEDPHEEVAHKADARLQGARRRSSASNGGSLPFSDPILSGKL